MVTAAYQPKKESMFCRLNGKKGKCHFIHFCVKKVTKVIFQPSKIGHISEQAHSCSQISHERARIANTLSTRVFDGFPVKTEQQNRKTGHENQGKRPTITP